MTGLGYKLEHWYVLLNIEDTHTVAKRSHLSTVLLSYYKMNFSA